MPQDFNEIIFQLENKLNEALESEKEKHFILKKYFKQYKLLINASISGNQEQLLESIKKMETLIILYEYTEIIKFLNDEITLFTTVNENVKLESINKIKELETIEEADENIESDQDLVGSS